ncbi:MAG: tRNA (adenosine(37)-N6)-threonylcarbamoyltransferase complex ATPase subunit type 1 TsaE [Acidobacteria bacterium]|nr:tRNA (adenosine(37)-N6)-threonylcarbamoyltransferase complex ATPase subunit type 1 TsaE [Acidobacteriota bacterium]
MVVELKTLNDTEKLAKSLVKNLKKESLILLFGDLGSGKTTFVKYLAKALGFKPSDVSSPSFTIVQEYKTKNNKIYHIDLYRLEDEKEIFEIGIEEILDGDSLVVVEWPQIGMKIFENCGRSVLRLDFSFKNNKRTVDLTNFDI